MQAPALYDDFQPVDVQKSDIGRQQVQSLFAKSNQY